MTRKSLKSDRNHVYSTRIARRQESQCLKNPCGQEVWRCQSSTDCLNVKSMRSVWCTKAELSGDADSENNHGGSSRTYVLHRTGSAQKDGQLLREDGSGKIHQQGKVGATRGELELDTWLKTLPQPWTAAMEATIFTGWIYDHLKPHAAAVRVAHPLMLRAIRRIQEEERSHRCRQARGLPAL
jgi:hypothetical protein